MHRGKRISPLVLVVSQISFVGDCAAQASDPKIVEAAKKRAAKLKPT